MVVVVDKEEYEAAGESGMKVDAVLKEVVDVGRVGSLQVEPQSLVIKEPGIALTVHTTCLIAGT